MKATEETDSRYGCKPSERRIEDHIKFGIINLDKPSGPSSHEVTAWVKRLLSLTHAGHGGTLDPKVTGILPIALEQATKVIQALQVSGKEYICVMKLHSSVSEQKIKTVMNEFVGEIYQRPPLRASVKRRLRTRKIYYLDLLEIQDRNVLFQVGCEAGTYIRKLCFDIGEALGLGAHMQELRRIRAGIFTETQSMVTFHEITYLLSLWKDLKDENAMRKFIQPMEKVLDLLPKIIIRDSAVNAICYGANLATPGVLALESNIKPNDTVAVLTQKGEGVALAKALTSTEDIIKMDHGIVAKTTRVLMPRDIYPKTWHKRKSNSKN